MTTHAVSRVATLVCVATLVVACGQKEQASLSPTAVADRYGWQNSHTIDGLPLFSLIPARMGRTGIGAFDVLVAHCAAAKGVRLPVPDRQIPPTQSPIAGARVFNVDIASRFGYQVDAAPLVAINEEFAAANLSPADEQVHAACVDTANREMPKEANLNATGDMLQAADDSAQKSPAVRAANAEWHDCMKSAGVRDLREGPSAQLQAVMMKSAAGSGDMSEQEIKQVEPSREEIELATTDARCQESSKWQRVLADQIAQEQLRLIGRSIDTFEADRDAGAKYTGELETIIARNGR